MTAPFLPPDQPRLEKYGPAGGKSSVGRKLIVACLFVSMLTLVAIAQVPDIVDTGRTIAGLTASEILGVVSVALVFALAYKDRAIYTRMEAVLDRNASASQEVKDALYSVAMTRAELIASMKQCAAVQEERGRAETDRHIAQLARERSRHGSELAAEETRHAKGS